MSDDTQQPADRPMYKEDDLVYVDPGLKTVVGPVEWTPSGKPKPKLMESMANEEEQDKEAKQAPKEEAAGGKERRRPQKKRYYPWGTYRSMRNVFKLEGKQRPPELNKPFDEILAKALQDPYWD